MPAPGAPAEAFVDAIVAAIGPHTRIVVVDHITAETALVLPVAEIAAACHAKGAQVLVDGAHVPGAIELDIDALGVDWYTANLHKWCWTPRSSGVLWASDEWRPSLRPTTISWGLGNGLGAEFDLLGTRDPTAFLAAPEAIAMMREWGVERVRGWNHGLAWQAGQLLSHRWGTHFDTPEEMVGTMVNVALPDASGSTDADAGAMRTHLWDAHRIEVPVFAHGGHLTLRVSAQVYNDLAQIELLADAVSAAGSRAAAS
jgi:isopenicillin-N epimerase